MNEIIKLLELYYSKTLVDITIKKLKNKTPDRLLTKNERQLKQFLIKKGITKLILTQHN